MGLLAMSLKGICINLLFPYFYLKVLQCMSSSCPNVPLTISKSYMSYKIERTSYFFYIYVPCTKVANPKCNTHFFRLALKAFKHLSYP